MVCGSETLDEVGGEVGIGFLFGGDEPCNTCDHIILYYMLHVDMYI